MLARACLVYWRLLSRGLSKFSVIDALGKVPFLRKPRLFGFELLPISLFDCSGGTVLALYAPHNWNSRGSFILPRERIGFEADGQFNAHTPSNAASRIGIRSHRPPSAIGGWHAAQPLI